MPAPAGCDQGIRGNWRNGFRSGDNGRVRHPSGHHAGCQIRFNRRSVAARTGACRAGNQRIATQAEQVAQRQHAVGEGFDLAIAINIKRGAGQAAVTTTVVRIKVG